MFQDYVPYVCDEMVEYLETEVCSALEEMTQITELFGEAISHEQDIVEAKQIGLRMEVNLRNGGYAGHIRYLEKMEVGRKRHTSKPKQRRIKAPHKR